MNQRTFPSRSFRRSGSSVTLSLCMLLSLAACGGSESSGDAPSTPSEGVGAAPAEATTAAPLGTGFIMVSSISELQMTDGTFLEESDCTARVSALGDAEEYESCMEVPPAAICLQLAEGTREADQWWECFVQEEGCEEAHAAHEVIREVGGYVREILLDCTESEMEPIFASM